jgi:ABC-2 type transport system ATP-binding protein
MDRVSKDYRGFRALSDVTFSIRKGEVLGYVGPNGAGKTTTIKAMVGLISDFSGTIRIAGNVLPRDRNQVHRLIGYLPQSVAFQEWRTVEHALSTLGLLSGIPADEIGGRISATLKIVGLEDQRHRKIIELSGGNVQKVGLAQALLHNPKFLVLDEPLGGLDPESRYNLKQVIRDLSSKGVTIFFSSHILSDVQDVATRVAILNRGQLMKIGTMEELKSEFSGPNVISVEIASGPGKLILGDVAGVISADVAGKNKFLIRLDPGQDPDEASNRVLRAMMGSGFVIRSFGPQNPNLDELYNRYLNKGVGQ